MTSRENNNFMVLALIGAVVSIIGGIVGEKVSSKSLMIFALVSLTIGMEGLTLAKGMDLNGILLMGI